MNNISVGDLVMVVKPVLCCGNTTTIGTIFTVKKISLNHGICAWCGKEYNQLVAFGAEDVKEVVRLKKIPPLAELETTEIKEEIPC